MKKLFILLVLAVAGCITSAFGQDILYLKNGSIIKGELVKALPNEKVQFQLSDGTILSYNTADAIKITKENVNQTTGRRDVVSLTNGSVIRGYLTEYIFGQKASLKTSDGSLFVYNADERDCTSCKRTRNSTLCCSDKRVQLLPGNRSKRHFQLNDKRISLYAHPSVATR